MFRKKGDQLGVMTAAGRSLEKAFELFGTPPERRNQIIVTKLTENDDYWP